MAFDQPELFSARLSKMKTYIGRFVNRETEQHLLDLICTYCETPWCSSTMKIKIFIRKNRDIGMIYAEKYNNSNNTSFVARRYLTLNMWIGQVNLFADKALELLTAARFYSRLAGLGLPISKLIQQIKYQNFLLSSF